MSKLPALSPFKLLQSYDKSDVKVYFGREKETRLLAESLKRSKFILLYGASGTGKTSLIQCGLQGMFSTRDWMPVFVRRGSGFLPSLRIRLMEEYATRFRLRYPNQSLPTLEDWPLRDLVKALFSLTCIPVYLILDQFEEIFTLGDKTEQDAFFQELVDFRLFEEDLFCKILLVVREEYIAHFYAYEEKLPFLFENRFRVEKMRREQLGEVVQKTLTWHYDSYPPFSTDSGTADQILDNLTDAKGETDLTDLQVYLDRLYREAAAKRPDDGISPLVFDRALAGQHKLENVLSVFLEEQTERADRKLKAAEGGKEHPVTLIILFKLVTPEGTKQHRNSTQIFEDLNIGKTPVEQIRLQTALALLCAPEMRLINRLKFTGSTDEYYEIWHDRLAAQVFKKFSADEMRQREALVTLNNKYKRFEAAESNKTRRAEYLSQGEAALIGQSLNLARISDTQRAFYEDSLNWHRQQRRKERLLLVTAVVAALVFAFLALAAWYAWQRSETARLHNQGLAESAFHPTEGLRKIAAAIQRDPDDPNKQRDFYEIYTANLLYAPLLTERAGPLNAAAFAPNGLYFATAVGPVVRLYRNGETTAVDSFAAGNAVNHVFFQSNDTLWAGSEDRKAYQFLITHDNKALRLLRSVETGENIQRFALDKRQRWLATLHNQPFVQLWEVRADSIPAQKWEMEDLVSATALSPDGQWWVAGTETGTLRIKSTNAAPESFEPQLLYEGNQVTVRQITFSPDRNRFAAAFQDGSLLLFEHDRSSQNATDTLPCYYKPIDRLNAGEAAWTTATFSDDGRLLLLCADNGTGMVMEVPSLRVLFRLWPGNHHAFLQAQWTNDQDYIRTAAADGSLRQWDFPRPFPDRLLSTGALTPGTLTYTTDGQYLLLQSADSLVRVFDGLRTEVQPAYTGHQHAVTALSCGLHQAASGDASGEVQLWDIANRTRRAATTYPDGPLRYITMPPEGNAVMMAGEDSTRVMIWRPATHDTFLAGPAKQLVTAIAVTPDGNAFWVAGFDSVVTRYNAQGKVTGRMRMPAPVLQLQISGSGDTLAVVHDTGTSACYLWQQPTAICTRPALETVQWEKNNLFYATFAPESSLGQRCTVSLLTRAGFPLQKFRHADCNLSRIALHPDGKNLVAISADGYLAIWKVRRTPALSKKFY